MEDGRVAERKRSVARGEKEVGEEKRGETKIKQNQMDFMVFSRPKEILSADTPARYATKRATLTRLRVNANFLTR